MLFIDPCIFNILLESSSEIAQPMAFHGIGRRSEDGLCIAFNFLDPSKALNRSASLPFNNLSIAGVNNDHFGHMGVALNPLFCLFGSLNTDFGSDSLYDLVSPVDPCFRKNFKEIKKQRPDFGISWKPELFTKFMRTVTRASVPEKTLVLMEDFSKLQELLRKNQISEFEKVYHVRFNYTSSNKNTQNEIEKIKLAIIDFIRLMEQDILDDNKKNQIMGLLHH